MDIFREQKFGLLDIFARYFINIIGLGIINVAKFDFIFFSVLHLFFKFYVLIVPLPNSLSVIIIFEVILTLDS